MHFSGPRKIVEILMEKQNKKKTKNENVRKGCFKIRE